MAITVNTLTNIDVAQDSNGAMYGFAATKSNTNYIEDPRTADRQIISKYVSLDINTDAVKVEFIDGTDYTIPAGSLNAGVLHPMKIVKVFSTGTGATVNVVIWI